MRSAFSLLLAAASLFASVGAAPSETTNVIGTVVKATDPEANGRLTVWPNGVTESTMPADEYHGTVEKRQVLDLSGATCQSTCSGAPGTGPNQSDCDVIINQLFSEGTQKFSVNPSSNVVIVSFASCRVTFVNFTGGVVVYQENDWGSVASFLAGACNAAHGFGQGRCTFDEANAFIEVLHN
ncbi:hypothetical protein GALMADRAFT_206107 [Galerina marginata CBS 339.88]|uniref:Ecp2 effector protein domain-containing protein n=1 Tax=Galerina marginata (strain CBS 339.88) TaxID=685588 RepID=A0A067TN06_GALM3|nr:hypothetical protein GALMADRAFT_206107 [Galerina marginata CBS 339.88]